jgi:hypothetical protein
MKRSMKGSVPVSRGYILHILEKIDTIPYKVRVGGGLTPDVQRIRNKALVSFLYLSARRISEVVGREYPWRKRGTIKHIHSDTWVGINVDDVRYDTLSNVEVMIVTCRILKKGSLKHGLKKDIEYMVIPMDDKPFITHITEWIEYQRSVGETKLFPLSRTGVYLILRRIDPSIVGPHWFRHQRLSHLAEYLNPYQLTADVGKWSTIEPSLSYVHGRIGDYLEATRKARGVS